MRELPRLVFKAKTQAKKAVKRAFREAALSQGGPLLTTSEMVHQGPFRPVA